MKPIYLIKITPFLLLILIISSCSESYNLQTDTYEEALVVEATITNEFKKQEIKLTKTAPLNDDQIKIEKGAKVFVHDNKGHDYYFQEVSEKYISETEFKAEPNTEYTLEITTSDGKKYQSSNEILTTENNIESITPNVVNTSKEGRGVQINVKCYDPNNSSKYYRYEFEETFKIIAPKWLEYKLVQVGPQEVDFVPTPVDTKICYTTKNSNDIIQTTTTNLQEDRVNFPVRFISDQNYIISHRYSILVRQYVQNLESYTFYKTLKEISDASSILSPKQPGFLSGNIKCLTSSEDKVIGFFDVSSVSSKRIFFNYEDLFPGEPLPPYYVECLDTKYLFCFGFSNPPCLGRQLLYDLNEGTIYYNTHDKLDYYMVPIQCGDCTTFSSNQIPSFWTN